MFRRRYEPLPGLSIACNVAVGTPRDSAQKRHVIHEGFRS